MTFYYYYSNGINNIQSVDQVQSYLSNFTPVYQKNSEIPNSSFYTWSFPQTEICTSNEVFLPIPSSISVEEIQNPTAASSGGSSKKRRIEKTLEKEIISAKKNSQSNLINQFYSFFGSRQKSERTVEKCCLLQGKSLDESERILPLFYMAIRYINAKRGRKYVNAAMLLKFFTPEEFATYLSEFAQKIEDCSFVNLTQLCQIFRRCTSYFLKNVCVSAILTSKRISIISKEEHLKKRRKIARTVLEN